MHTSDHPDDPARELATVQQAIAQARATLAGLRADVIAAEKHFGSRAAAQLLEANEQLVLSALRVQTQADTAAQQAAAALREVSRSAELDALTGLPNRLVLLDRLTQAIASAKRHRCRAAVLFLDLNNFKQINDTLGHAVGDQVLRLAAGRLGASVREVDTVSRLGGDEFVILLGEVGHASDAQGIAEKIGAALGAPGRIGDHVIRLSASIGISLYPDDGDDADALIARADDAMYCAKRRGLRSFVFGNDEAAARRPEPSPATLRALQRPLTAYEQAHADHEQQRALLQEANENLVIAALTAQQLQAAAEQAQARQVEVLALVSHELRAPLAPIRAAAALLNQGRADAPLLQYVQSIIERQVVHMSRLVGDLLDVSRGATGKLRLQRQAVDMSVLIDAAVQACRPAMDARLQHFLAFVPEGAMVVDGDPVRLTQVLCNLLDNASKYTQVGGEIGLSATAADGSLAVAVSDNGIGITAEALQQVFDPFVQDRHAIGFNGSGLGIGLTVVRELVEAHGGSVVASSAGIGFGSRFVVTLPLHATAATR